MHAGDSVRDVALGPDRGDNLREGQVFRTMRAWQILRGDRLPLGDEEAMASDAQGSVVVKVAPAATIIMPKAKLLLELTIVTLDAS